MKDILLSDDLDHIEKFTVQFRRIYDSGINKDKTGYLKERVYNTKAQDTDFNQLLEIQNHNIYLDNIQDMREDELNRKIFSIVSYMVKYQAFIIIKAGSPGSKIN